jgi:hypothetical protein
MESDVIIRDLSKDFPTGLGRNGGKFCGFF